jgi:hypothetical protein
LGVIAELGATLWKMFAGDVPLSAATLAIVAFVVVATRTGVLAAALAPLLLAGLVLSALALTVGLAIARETSKRTNR